MFARVDERRIVSGSGPAPGAFAAIAQKFVAGSLLLVSEAVWFRVAVVLAGAAVGPHAKVGELCIINTNAPRRSDKEYGQELRSK